MLRSALPGFRHSDKWPEGHSSIWIKSTTTGLYYEVTLTGTTTVTLTIGATSTPAGPALEYLVLKSTDGQNYKVGITSGAITINQTPTTEGVTRLLLKNTTTAYYHEPAVSGNAGSVVSAIDPNTKWPYPAVKIHYWEVSSPRVNYLWVAEVDLNYPGLVVRSTAHSGSMDTVRIFTKNAIAAPSGGEESYKLDAHVGTGFGFYYPTASGELAEAYYAGFGVSDGSLVSPFENQPFNTNPTDQGYAIMQKVDAIVFGSNNKVRKQPRIAQDNGSDITDVRHAISGAFWIITDGQLGMYYPADSTGQTPTATIKIPDYYGTTNNPPYLKELSGYNDATPWFAAARARTLAGFNRGGTRFFICCGQKINLSLGLSVPEIAQAVIDKNVGVWQAMNLDGGGSTQLALRNPLTSANELLNIPESSDRAVAAHIAFRSPPWT